jgi:hypothetical protein
MASLWGGKLDTLALPTCDVFIVLGIIALGFGVVFVLVLVVLHAKIAKAVQPELVVFRL